MGMEYRHYRNLVLLLLFVSGVFYYASKTTNNKNCSDFIDKVEAQEYYNSHTNWLSRDQSGLDRDGDGWVCESLPSRKTAEVGEVKQTPLHCIFESKASDCN